MYKVENSFLRKVWPLFMVALLALIAVSGYAAINSKSNVSAAPVALTLDCSTIMASQFANNTIIVAQVTNKSGQLVESHYYDVKTGLDDQDTSGKMVFGNLQSDTTYVLKFIVPTYSSFSFFNEDFVQYNTTHYQFTTDQTAVTFTLSLTINQDSWFSDTTVV